MARVKFRQAVRCNVGRMVETCSHVLEPTEGVTFGDRCMVALGHALGGDLEWPHLAHASVRRGRIVQLLDVVGGCRGRVDGDTKSLAGSSQKRGVSVPEGFGLGVDVRGPEGSRQRANSDESYVIDLCDSILGQPASRQHRFEWLKGDPGRSGRRVRLPVDAYWAPIRLVVEYRENQHDVPTPFFDKPERLTVSGVHRGLQRALYDQRREVLIPAHGLHLLILRPTDLQSDSRGRLLRMIEPDRASLVNLLKTFLAGDERLPHQSNIGSNEA